MPDIEKLRRFSLVIALVIIFYSIAGISLDVNTKASILGIPFVIKNPDLLLIGFLIASIYGLARFYYYGIMLSDSPHRERKDILHNLHAESGHGNYKGSAFFGPNKFSTTPSTPSHKEVTKEFKSIVKAFPKIGKIRVTGKIKSSQGVDGSGEIYTVYHAEITIPFVCRLGAIVQDIDYTAPIWASIAAYILVALS
jgi:hypothetical protein